jgi:hypothetical protein
MIRHAIEILALIYIMSIPESQRCSGFILNLLPKKHPNIAAGVSILSVIYLTGSPISPE